jgi:hypothetical protein
MGSGRSFDFPRGSGVDEKRCTIIAAGSCARVGTETTEKETTLASVRACGRWKNP